MSVPVRPRCCQELKWKWAKTELILRDIPKPFRIRQSYSSIITRARRRAGTDSVHVHTSPWDGCFAFCIWQLASMHALVQPSNGREIKKRNKQAVDGLAKVIIIDQPEASGKGMAANPTTGRSMTDFAETNSAADLFVIKASDWRWGWRGGKRNGGKSSEMCLGNQNGLVLVVAQREGRSWSCWLAGYCLAPARKCPPTR
jgi:hypothetical protein